MKIIFNKKAKRIIKELRYREFKYKDYHFDVVRKYEEKLHNEINSNRW